MLLEGQDAESRTVFRKKEHNVGRFSGIYVFRPWNPLNRVLPLPMKSARTGCTSAKSKLSAFGLHCPSPRQKTKTLKGRTKDAT